MSSALDKTQDSTDTGDESVDVAVVGGGVAGLSAAIALSRFRRSVVVIDSGNPRNAPADGLHNFLGHDGVDPQQLLATGRDELEYYAGRVRDDVALRAESRDGRIDIGLQSGSTVSARRVIVASGTVDVLPDVAGIEDRWGRDVVHCPYCHGWEVRDRPIGVLATNPGAAMQQALMFNELSDDVRVFTHVSEPLNAEQRAQLDALAIGIVDGRVEAVLTENDTMTGVRLVDGRTEAIRALAVATGLETRSPVLDSLGVEHDPDGPGGYASDSTGATSVEGVWVAGNVTSPYDPLVIAAAAGMTAAGEVNGDLVAERARCAVRDRAA